MQQISIFEAIGRLIIAICILLGSLVVFDLLIYITVMNASVGKTIHAAYEDSYREGYAQTYDSAYQLAFNGAYEEGYEKGHQIGLGTEAGEKVATRVELHNPTYDEVREFLARDMTDSNPYIKGVYMCADFAADVNNNAEFQGIRTAYVIIHARAWSHAVVAFETTDKGLVSVEPISDAIVGVVVGRPYRWTAGGDISTLTDDIVVELEFIW